MRLCFATSSEKSMPLPGDQFVESPRISSTHAITIDAPTSEVWPWIVQIGQGRGGFYSYSFLENIFGCKIKNAEAIHPEWQSLKLGEAIHLHPRFPPMIVEQIDFESHLVLAQRSSIFWTWAFVITHIAKNQSRLLIRTRVTSNLWLVTALLYPAMTCGHYVMERRMLVGIKRRSETRVCW